MIIKRKDPHCNCNPWQQQQQNSEHHHQQQEEAHSSVRQPQEATSLVADLNALSINERNQVYEEIHGVAGVMEESPRMVNTKVKQLKQRLKKMPKHKRKDLDKAFFLKPSLKEDRAFHLMFLRSKRFNVEEAAESICLYFTNKIALFGENLIVERITLQHLDEAAVECIRVGSHQFLKGRESTGRWVLACTVGLWAFHDWKAYAQYVWYNIMTIALEDEDAQKRGFVSVFSFHHSFKPRDAIFIMRKMESFHNHWPFYLNAIHHIHDNPTYHVIFSAVNAVIPQQQRVRQRFHYGSLIETKHAMMSFGIDVHDCFEAGIGTLSPQFAQFVIAERSRIEEFRRKHEIMIMERRKMAATAPTPTLNFGSRDHHSVATTIILSHPKPCDVLMGRLWHLHVKNWSGNNLFTTLVQDRVSEYNAIDPSNRSLKTSVTSQIVQDMHTMYQSRFVERTEKGGGGWIEVSDDTARIKASQVMRALCRQAEEE